MTLACIFYGTADARQIFCQIFEVSSVALAGLGVGGCALKIINN